MKRLLFYLLLWIAFAVRVLRNRRWYVKCFVLAHKIQGVKFNGLPRYIHSNAMLDPLGGLELGDKIVISTNVIILTHDYSYTVGLDAIGKRPPTDMALFQPVKIAENCFVGAGAVILPGTTINKFSIIGAGSVVKGNFAEYSIIAGNPAKVIGNTVDWGTKILTRFHENELHFDIK